ncbi:MAG: hypothetical protein HC795_19355, partial [Coleofasciculaceae cyanobacterium RL_1_1]|nr:hypothetical protein [Coleofasciculaceae cyanobacterium RL_1_1]
SELYRAAGYQSGKRSLVLHRDLAGFRPVVDRQQMQIRRTTRLESMVDLIVDDGRDDGVRASTILDLTADEPKIVREGAGIEEALAWI